MRDSYVPNFKIPSPRKPSGKMWVTIVLCVLLPPVGMVLLWGRTRCPIRGKVLMTFVSVAVMVAMIALALQFGVNANARRSIYTNAAPTPAATVVPAMPASTVMPANPSKTDSTAGTDGGESPEDASDGVIPANPAT